ncbi:hypothetical protein HDU80_002864, partial [Chytriomyces hyalinus]
CLLGFHCYWSKAAGRLHWQILIVYVMGKPNYPYKVTYGKRKLIAEEYLAINNALQFRALYRDCLEPKDNLAQLAKAIATRKNTII